MIVERSSHPQFVSNTYLVADGDGGPAFFIDAGGPVEPLIEAAERSACSHARAAHPSPLRPRQRRGRAARALARAAGADRSAERELLAGPAAMAGRSVGTIEAGADAALRSAGGAATADAGAHRGDALVPRRRGPGRAPGRPPRPTARRRGRVHRRHAVQGLGRRREGARAHHLRGPARLDHGNADGAARRDRHLSGARRAHDGRSRVGANAFIRVWRGLDPEGCEPCTALGQPATLVLLGADYDGGHEGLGALGGRSRRHRARLPGASAAASAAVGSREPGPPSVGRPGE